MKKLNYFLVLFLMVSLGIHAQEDDVPSTTTDFGLKAGYTSLSLKVSVDGESASDNVSGFYVGAFAELHISETFSLQPELYYSTYYDSGENTSVLNVPIMAKYYVDERFAIFAGPQFDYLLEKEASEGIERFGIALAAGLAFDVTDQVLIDLRYAFGLTNRLDAELPGLEQFDVKTYFNYLHIGLGYRF
ncbi:porin family protein [Psychroserpens sp. XS_ASV72]|uniref:porin family protein n=1 Tax=Psychroserpens sp. XS_ASV72 TaxID=3241293 RepID=UPI003514EAF8